MRGFHKVIPALVITADDTRRLKKASLVFRLILIIQAQNHF